MTSMPNSPVMSTPETPLSGSQPTKLYTLYYHQRLKRYLLTTAHEPTPDFIEKPGEESYKTFGGRRNSVKDVHEIGTANTVDELKQFVMVMNSIVNFEPIIAEDVDFYLALRNAFKKRFANLITDIH